MIAIERLYHALEKNPALSNAELAELLGCPEVSVRVYKKRLRDRGFIGQDENGQITILAPFEGQVRCRKGRKFEVYSEMLEFYMEDFRAATGFADRVLIGREIRLLLEKIG